MIETVTAYKSMNGRLYLTEDEARQADAAYRRAEKFDELARFFNRKTYQSKDDLNAMHRIIDSWHSLKKIMEGTS